MCADSGVLVPLLSFPHFHHSHLPLTLTLDEKLLRRKQFWLCKTKSVAKGIEWGSGEATGPILSAPAHVSRPGASQHNCALQPLGNLSNTDSKVLFRPTKSELLGVRAQGFPFFYKPSLPAPPAVYDEDHTLRNTVSQPIPD